MARSRRYGVEEFIADNVVVLRNVLEEEQRRRTLELLKFRGTDHQKGEYPFTIEADRGLVVIPLTGIPLEQRSSNIARQLRERGARRHVRRRLLPGFDGAGLGATGTGKTLTVTHFLAGGAAQGSACLLFGFEESREQLVRNAAGWGVDFESMERDGVLHVYCEYPEARGLRGSPARA